jgi:hypothetical protein
VGKTAIKNGRGAAENAPKDRQGDFGMDSDQFDIDIPDTIPTYIQRRHQKSARRAVHRTGRARRALPTPSGWVSAFVAVVLIAGSFSLMAAWPSTLTYVVIPAALLSATIPFALIRLARRAGLDQT